MALAAALATLAMFTTPVVARDVAPFGFGKAATPAEIAGWDIDVRPDGRGLPPGHGSVREGQKIYDAKCASCHGTFGESNSYLLIAGGVGSLGTAQPVRTTGSKLNYATTLFDYIRRAMPLTAPQSLTADEVYALTAYVLNLNDIVRDDVTLDAASLASLRMPNRDGFTTAHGLMRRDGVSDTHNAECMHDCVQQVAVTSRLPDYAVGTHGDIASQMRSFTHVAAAPTPGEVGTALARHAGCIACHAVDARVVGPSFREVAARYHDDAGAPARLVAKLRDGGSGAWGSVPMPAQSLPDADARALLRWILDGAP
ncbi:MAG: c-type cytochrome [Betaproteobacteria bacterium]